MGGTMLGKPVGRLAVLVLSTALLSSTFLIGIGGADVGAATTGKSYTVMVTGAFSGTFGDTSPEIIAAAKGAARDVPGMKNITCDSGSTAAAAQSCAHSAVQDGVSAVIVGLSELTEDESILNAAGIPVLGE